MAGIDDFFNGKSDELPDPRLRDWADRIRRGANATLELYRPRATIGLAPTKIYVHLEQNGAQQPLDEADWDEHLNEGLISLKVRAVDSEQEAQRFALGLRDALRPVEKELGNGYFNAVLLDVIVDSKLDQYPEITEVLEFTYHDRTARGGQAYSRCREAISMAISARARELTERLRYSADEAKNILVAALAGYLDERFSVTPRREFVAADIVQGLPNWSDRNLRWLIDHIARRNGEAGQTTYTVIQGKARALCDRRRSAGQIVADECPSAARSILVGVEGHEFGRCNSNTDCYELAARMGLAILYSGSPRYFGHAVIREA